MKIVRILIIIIFCCLLELTVKVGIVKAGGYVYISSCRATCWVATASSDADSCYNNNEYVSPASAWTCCMSTCFNNASCVGQCSGDGEGQICDRGNPGSVGCGIGYCSSQRSDCCGSGYNNWTKYKVGCTNNSKWNEYICDPVWQVSATVCSTGDKCLNAEHFVRAGLCDCNLGGAYKICCSTTPYEGTVPCRQLSGDGLYPPEGGCPPGSAAISVPGEYRIDSNTIDPNWIESVCPNCSPVAPIEGVCGDLLNTCAVGNPSGVGTTRVVAGVGVYDTWICNGIDGSCPVVAADDDDCSSFKCGAVDGISGACKNGVDPNKEYPCFNPPEGTPDGVVNNGDGNWMDPTKVNFLWSCIGTTGICGGIDGIDASNCSSPVEQDAWFQAQDGGVLAKGSVVNQVPPSCVDADEGGICRTVWMGATNGVGLVAAGSNISKSDDFDKTNNFVQKNLVIDKYNYDYFYQQYFLAQKIGTTFDSGDGSKVWSWKDDIKDNLTTNTDGVVFINGKLTIDGAVDTGKFLMLVAKNDIVIDGSVNTVKALLIGDNISVGDSGSQLTITGAVYGASGVKFARSYEPKSGNNASPAVVVKYDPNLIFNLPKGVNKRIKWSTN